MELKIVDVDLLKVFQIVNRKKKIIAVLAWGDPIHVGTRRDDVIPVSVKSRTRMKDGSIKAEDIGGFISAKAKLRDPAENDIMRFTIVDVQQGDAAVLETPAGARVFIDGGENQMFARYLATRYPGTTRAKPLPVNAIIVTHGDADHYKGLIRIRESEKNKAEFKRLFIRPELVLHNGLVKRVKTTVAEKAFGKVVKSGDRTYVTELADDLVGMTPRKMVPAFEAWSKFLKSYASGLTVKRLSDKTNTDAFDFLTKEKINVRVLSPRETEVDGKPALPLMHDTQVRWPQTGDLAGVPQPSSNYGVSQTINGNSIVLLLEYGSIRLLLTGDMNAEAEAELLKQSPDLSAHVLKVPHHGSADFSPAFLHAISPVVSVISSGDESERVEYIHPRASLVGALGKYSRVGQPLIFVTELAAFFKTMGYAKLVKPKKGEGQTSFFAFSRTAYGVVHISFNKERMLVFTHTGKRDLKEAYAFSVTGKNTVKFEKVVQG